MSRRSPHIYSDYRKNHVVWPGSEPTLDSFVHKRYGGLQHKFDNARSSNSEDALTWSCFECLARVEPSLRRDALSELWELAYDGKPLPGAVADGQILVGETYGKGDEKTEVDASIDGRRALVFVEAKLYSPMSQANPKKPYNQIARKLRVGTRTALDSGREFYFLILDLAPWDKLKAMNPRASRAEAEAAQANGFGQKWLTAWWYHHYKFARGNSTTPIREVLEAAPAIGADARQVKDNMGWLTWADLFKVVLRAVVRSRTVEHSVETP